VTASSDANAVKILIVDDEIIIVADLEHRVRAMGYTVCGVAASGRQALEAAFRARPDLVLMDVVLQGEMDGIETAQVIRDTLGIPSVFITAYAGDDRLERAKLAYPFGYILKPFQDRDLRVTIEMALYVARNEAERRRNEASLRFVEKQLRNLGDSLPDGAVYRIVHGPDGHSYFDYTSAGFTGIFELSGEVVAGDAAPLYELLHPEDGVAALEAQKQSGDTLQPFRHECRFILPSGKVRWVRWHSMPEPHPEGGMAWNGVALDITDRRLVEAELEQTKNELEERVRQRTRDLEVLNSHLVAEIEDRKRIEANLITQQERLNRLASELVLTEERERRQLAVILHDQIGQSLAFCKMQIKAMINKSELPEPAGQMRQVCDTIDLMIRTSRSLTLDLSPPILYELGLKAAVEWVAERMESDFTIPIEVKGAGPLPPLADDLKVLLFRAIKELLVNAVKHALPSRIRVLLSADRERIQVKVRDDGVGFPQAEPAQARQTSGGYGLFNIKERLASLGGWMVVESESGWGTEITLIIPLNHTAKRL
jgi:signal transduction histidine kinase/AmiR/NasT family two-component response regulator